jgi:hypothetical protein
MSRNAACAVRAVAASGALVPLVAARRLITKHWRAPTSPNTDFGQYSRLACCLINHHDHQASGRAIFVWKFPDTYEETVRCGFSASDRFVNLALVLVI